VWIAQIIPVFNYTNDSDDELSPWILRHVVKVALIGKDDFNLDRSPLLQRIRYAPIFLWDRIGARGIRFSRDIRRYVFGDCIAVVCHLNNKGAVTERNDARWFHSYWSDRQPSAFLGLHQKNAVFSRSRALLSGLSLIGNRYEREEQSQNCGSFGPSEDSVNYHCFPTWQVPLGFLAIALGLYFVSRSDCRATTLGGWCCGIMGILFLLTGYEDRDQREYARPCQIFLHNSVIVRPKTLTHPYYWFTVIDRGLVMANALSTDKKIAIIGQLAEGSSIRSIERITGVHRDTIMRLGVRVGQGCTALMDDKMRNLPCNRLEMDEIWGFIGKKDRHVREGDDPQFGNVWTWCAIDAETKLVPAFRVGQRDAATANAFLRDVASRMTNRVQISTDGLNAYVDAVEMAFGGDADYGQIIKTYGVETSIQPQRRYSAPEITAIEKKAISGRPNFDLISTSYIERLNATTRLHMKRLARLTHAFSKKRVNFEAAVGLHFAYYNFVKRHSTIRCTPAMAAGVTGSFWSVADLVEAAA